VSRSTVLAHIVRDADGTSTGVWGPFTLKTAFQPIFVFDDGKLFVTAFEGLIRPFCGGEAVTPAAFFGGVEAADRFSIETLTRTLHLYNAAACLPQNAAIFVNFDPSVFTDGVLAGAALSDMRGTLRELGIDPERIVCEVTEQKTASSEALRDFTRALRHSGFGIAVDDFGSESSDIERVRAMRPEIVKFDAYWTARLMNSGSGLLLLTAMVEGFARQGITSVFEGIEENWRLEIAEKVGAAMVQGYALARPEVVPASFAILPSVPLAEVTARSTAGPRMAVQFTDGFGRKLVS
jgi:EAL domain-containing protein (putative c-di-GMP-specific phosphodiesterase class I)